MTTSVKLTRRDHLVVFGTILTVGLGVTLLAYVFRINIGIVFLKEDIFSLSAEPSTQFSESVAFEQNRSLVWFDVVAQTFREIPIYGHHTWSPDGNQIAFVDWFHRDDTNLSVFVWDVPTHTATLIEAQVGKVSGLAWSPNGQFLAITTYDQEGLFVIVDLHDRSRVVIETKADGDAEHPAWAPDSASLLFHIHHAGRAFIYHVQRDGQGLVRLTEGAAPSWSPTGDQFVFEKHDDIYLWDVLTGTERGLITSGDSETAPSWSPDGVHIALARQERDFFLSLGVRDSPPVHLYVLNLHTGELVRHTSDTLGLAGTAIPLAWSPSGSALVFKGEFLARPGEEPLYAYAICVADFLQRRITIVTRDGREPSWRP